MTLSCWIHLWLVVLSQVHRQSCWANCGAQKTERSVELEVTSLCSHSLKECGKTIFKDISINYRYRHMFKSWIEITSTAKKRREKHQYLTNLVFGWKTCLQNTLAIYLVPIFFWLLSMNRQIRRCHLYVKNDNSRREWRCFKKSQARNKLVE